MSTSTRTGAGRLVRLAAGLAVTALAATGCSLNLQSVKLPGGTATGSDVYRVTVVFDDVLDLVPQASVQVDQVPVGDVEKIDLDGFQARVTLRLKDSVKLPENSVARLTTTSLLGEKYVALSPPAADPSAALLKDGDEIVNKDTTSDVTIEELLSSLSLLLNGGGLEQLQTINVELNQVLAGREDDIRGLLDQLNVFVGGLDQQKSDIVRALEGLDKLSATLQQQKSTITTALDDIAPGLKVINQQEDQLVSMLQSLSDLGAVGTRVINETKDDTEANLALLQPLLVNLTGAGDNLRRSYELLTTYPFPKTTFVGSAGTPYSGGIQGDFAGLYATLDLNIQQVLDSQLGGGLPALPALPELPVPVPSLPTLPNLPLPNLPLPDLPLPDLPLPIGGLPVPVQPPTVLPPTVPAAPPGSSSPGSGSGGGLDDLLGGALR